ncbi:hypothetical protein G4B88_008212 [Cannabis sativa]|uniref:Secreted protein n=1 Tax=Cannabis sativa TaxID=3483 RepID=A0A7J6EJT2_CANSA|nr:hypothetical protein G4B88_008212 [Cannabis sativa]
MVVASLLVFLSQSTESSVGEGAVLPPRAKRVKLCGNVLKNEKMGLNCLKRELEERRNHPRLNRQ